MNVLLTLVAPWTFTKSSLGEIHVSKSAWQLGHFIINCLFLASLGRIGATFNESIVTVNSSALPQRLQNPLSILTALAISENRSFAPWLQIGQLKVLGGPMILKGKRLTDDYSSRGSYFGFLTLIQNASTRRQKWKDYLWSIYGKSTDTGSPAQSLLRNGLFLLLEIAFLRLRR